MNTIEQSESNRGEWHVYGHNSALNSFQRSLDRPAHAYLILGPHGVGKRTLAIELSMALNCDAETAHRPCHGCNSCRLIEQGIHPDVSYIQPDERAFISIEQVRALRQDLAMLPNQGRWRIAIVQADLLSEPAADALLKTLEEPNEQVVLILTGGDMFTIPETIVSRCRVIQLGLVPAGVIADALRAQAVDDGRARELAELAYGSIGWALTAAGNPEEVTQRKSLRDDLARWRSESLLDRLAAAEAVASAGKPDKVRALAMEELETMMTFWRDVLLAASGQGDLMLGAARPEDAASTSLQTALNAIREIARAATRIRENVDSRLTLEALTTSI